MSHIDPGPLASYESLSDPNLTSYFGNSRMKKHLIKSGLVTRKGEIVSEKVFRLNNARKEHQRHVRDLLAQAIVHKALDMERHRQMKVKKQLEEIGKIERVRRVRADRALRGDEDILPLLTPRSRQKETTDKKDTMPGPLGASDPFVPDNAPYNTRSSRVKTPYPNVEIDNQHLAQLDQEALRSFTLNLGNYDLGSGVSPYNVPVLDPASRQALSPPKKTLPKSAKKRQKHRHVSKSMASSHQTSGLKSVVHSRKLHRPEPPMIHRNQPRSKCLITFKYLGQIVQLDCEKEDPRDDISIYQQHCGGENLCVYNGRVLPGETFTIMSQRHRGFPFSLTFYLNGIQAERLSTCCEYKHKTGYKLGSKSSYFGFIKVLGAHPCYKCLVSQGKLNTVEQGDISRKQAKKSTTPLRKRRRNIVKSSSSDGSNAIPQGGEVNGNYSSSFSSSEEDSSSVSSVTSLTASEIENKKNDHKIKSNVNNGHRSSSPKPQNSRPTTVGNPEPDQASSKTSNSSTSSYSNTETDDNLEETNPPNYKIGTIEDLLKNENEISITNIKISDDQCAELCKALREHLVHHSVHSIILNNLSLSCEKFLDIFAALLHCRVTIKKLDIKQSNLCGSAAMNLLLEVFKKHEISNFILDENPLTDNDVETLLTGLSSLHEQRVFRRNEQQVVQHLVKDVISESTAELHSEGHGGDVELELSGSMKEFPLTNLSLNKIRLGARGVKAVADFLITNPSLTVLQLNGNFLTSTGVLPLWQGIFSGKNTKLKKLFLAHNQFGDQGVGHLCALNSTKSNLEELNLCDNGITEKGGKELLKFVNKNKEIRKIRLSHGNRIKHKTLKNIKKVLAERNE